MKVKQLPRNPDYGVMLVCSDGCDGEYSAHQGDYFLVEPEHTLRCHCMQPMKLVRKVTMYKTIKVR